MNTDGYNTPQKTKSMAPLSALLPQKVDCNGVGSSPIRNIKKPLHPRTPNASQSSSSIGCSSFHVFPNQLINTPPAKRFHRVRNPFEAALAERLHLPLIGSPSLFQRPTTPQLSSTQFEWTIEDVSSLKPANLEPDETQFQESPDADYEAKAQSAISSYFKEQKIVPSPVDCPLRAHRIIMSELNGNTPISKPGRRIRDCGTQTELSLPAVLPMLLEEALKPYFLPHLAENSEIESTPIDRVHRIDINVTNSSGEIKDTSLRRKLFDMHNIIVLDGDSKVFAAGDVLSHSNSSPMSVDTLDHTTIAGKLSDSMDKSSFGSLSPISASDGLSISPQSPRSGKRKSRMRNFLDFCEAETLSPILPPTRNVLSRRKSFKNCTNTGISNEYYRSAANVSEKTFADLSDCGDPNKTDKFNPDRSSSPLNCLGNAEHSIDNSFNIKVSRLVVNSNQSLAVKKTGKNVFSYPEKCGADVDLFSHDDMIEVDEDDMQIGQLSAQNSICSSSNSDTPRGKRRSASRKNLSQSFTANWYEDEEQEQQAKVEKQSRELEALFKSDSGTTIEGEKNEVISAGAATNDVSSEQRLLIYRTDSGFNEMTSGQTTHNNDPFSGAPQSLESDISIACCSTPSKIIADEF